MGERTHVTTFNPNPMQRQFIESRARADLFSSRRGEGKSTALCWSVYYHTLKNPGANWAVVRDTFENLQRTTMKEFFKWFPIGVYGTYHVTKKEWTWAEGVARGTVTFVGMDDPADASRFLSWELAGFAMDEPAPAVSSGGIDEMVFDLGMTCLRQPGMKWYAAKLAENNPDESHWTYRKFVDPGLAGFKLWQPPVPENLPNLPPDYYGNMRATLAHRPDLIRRFVDGEFGFQSAGRSVTPQWQDSLHLATGLAPAPRVPLHLGYDFGHNPTCLVTQVTPLGHWLILDALVGDGIGIVELIEDEVRPLLNTRYAEWCKWDTPSWDHIGDPAGLAREQTSIQRSAVAAIRSSLGGVWRSGPVKLEEGLEPLRAVLTRTCAGTGLVRVDRMRAAAVWHALRGGWHFPVNRNSVVGGQPVKNDASHPGDAMRYLAAVLFPLGRLSRKASGKAPEEPRYFRRGPLGFERPNVVLPKDGEVLR